MARHKGKTLFITGLLPGERADITLTEEKRQYARGQVKRRLNDSPERVMPRCPHFGVCGGCQQQHASTELQQKVKAARCTRLVGHDVNDIIADRPQGYRRRARLSLSYQSKTERLEMGFRKAGSSDIVSVTQCPVLVPHLEALLPDVHHCLASLDGVRSLVCRTGAGQQWR